MATKPPSSVVAPMAAPVPAEFTKFTFRTLYIRRTDPGSKEMSQAGRPSDQLGRRNISDCPIYDGRGSDATLVGRIQGLSVLIGNAHQLVTVVFEIERLKGSTLLTNGMVSDGSDEWAIYGGTGVFAMATGVIKRKNLPDRTGGNTDELSMEVFCPMFGSSSIQFNLMNSLLSGRLLPLPA